MSSATSIGSYAFRDCSKLSTIDFGNELTAVPTLANVNAFDGLPSNYVIKVPDTLYGDWIAADKWKTVSSHIRPQTENAFILKSVGGDVCIFDAADSRINRNLAYVDSSKNVLEPYKSNPELHYFDSVVEANDENGEISSVDNYAFNWCSSLLSVSLPNATSIGYEVFYNCLNLSSVNLSNVTSIGINAFNGCSKLSSVNLPKATSIDGQTFLHCPSLISVSLPNATSIGNNAFYSCLKLSSVDLPKATSIGNDAFGFCSSLSSVDLPKAASIGNEAFWYCWELSSVSLPNATSIGSYAFRDCSKLSTIDFGNELTAVPTLANVNAFDGLPSNYVIKVPDTLYGDWIAADKWKTVSSHIRPQNQ